MENKPLPIVMDEARKALVGALNESGLPACILAPLVKELYEAVTQAAQAELERAKAEIKED